MRECVCFFRLLNNFWGEDIFPWPTMVVFLGQRWCGTPEPSWTKRMKAGNHTKRDTKCHINNFNPRQKQAHLQSCSGCRMWSVCDASRLPPSNANQTSTRTGSSPCSRPRTRWRGRRSQQVRGHLEAGGGESEPLAEPVATATQPLIGG